MSNIAFIDVVFLVLLGIFAIRGYVRGFVTELFSWAAMVVGIIAAVFLYHGGAVFIRDKTALKVEYLPEILAFVAIFLIVFVLIKIIEGVLKDIVTGVNISGVDKFLGIIFGVVEGIAIISLTLFILIIQPVFSPDKILSESFFAEILLPFVVKPAAEAALPGASAFIPAFTVRTG
jgi:membrane protein required for colicin V production